MFIFLADEVAFAEVDEVDYWFRAEEEKGVDYLDLKAYVSSETVDRCKGVCEGFMGSAGTYSHSTSVLRWLKPRRAGIIDVERLIHRGDRA